VPNPGSPVLTRLDLPGAPARWEAFGFSIPSGELRIGQVACRLGASEASWGFDRANVLISDVAAAASPHSAVETPPPTTHANGAFKVDHIVLASDDPVGTKSQLESFGFVAKGARVGGAAGAQRSQTFFWSGELLLELVGPANGGGNEAPRARIWGITFVVDDLDRLEQTAGELVSSARTAVQPGRKIAIASEDAGIDLKVAFMSPHIRRSETEK
jgi:hypothetical protein